MSLLFCLLAATPASKVAGWFFAAFVVFLFFSVTVLVHEGGHFLAARWLGLRADAFSIGFGPALWERKVGGVRYRIGAIPFGGYVALPQLDPAGMERLQGKGDPATAGKKGDPIPPAVWWKRAIVAFAGPFCNLVFAVVLALLVWALPPPVPKALRFEGAVVGEVEPDSCAAEAGLRPGDRILAVAGTPVDSWGLFIQESHFCAESNRVELTVSNLYDHAVGRLSAPLLPNEIGILVVSGAVQAAACAVGDAFPGGGAAAAGLREDDVVLTVDGARVVSTEALSRLFEGALAAADGRGEAQARVRLGYYRDGKVGEAELALGLVPSEVPFEWVGQGALVDDPAEDILEDHPERFQSLDLVLAVDGEPVSGGWAELLARLRATTPPGAERTFSVSNLLSREVREVRSARPWEGLVPAEQCRIGAVVAGSPAEEAGVKPGDVVVALNGAPVVSPDDFRMRVRHSGGRTLDLLLLSEEGMRRAALVPREMSVERGRPKRWMAGVALVPVMPPEAERGTLLAGLAPRPVGVAIPVWARHRRPGPQLKGDVESILRILRPLFGRAHKGERGKIGRAIGGPVSILSSMWSWLLLSIPATIAFVRFLNVNLAILNLLPIPVLDGGHIVFALWRGVRGKEIPARVIDVLVNAFAALLLALFVFLSGRDLWSLSRLFHWFG